MGIKLEITLPHQLESMDIKAREATLIEKAPRAVTKHIISIVHLITA